ncbi:NUDIX hydrolase [Jiangella alkaliphila]|uniref:hypothetical protein n=1 Tax=Jiangella alkaliphila TaxID=419479 RepID=UPI000699A0EA|nr:hypothetical protein [Jiangella alkaliphila]
MTFEARWIGGELRGSDESTALQWVDLGDLAAVRMQPSQRRRLEHYARDGASRPHVDQLAARKLFTTTRVLRYP